MSGDFGIKQCKIKKVSQAIFDSVQRSLFYEENGLNARESAFTKIVRVLCMKEAYALFYLDPWNPITN